MTNSTAINASSAGPSRISASDSPGHVPATPTARWRHLPRHLYTSIEYPGPVSSPSAILNVITQKDIDECLNTPAAVSSMPILEASYGRDVRQQAIPVRGHRVPSQKVLVKIKRRRRKAGNGSVDNGVEKSSKEGVFTAEIVGTVTHTVRFRSMADYQYTPSQDSGIADIVRAIRDLDYDTILDYEFPPLHEQTFEPTTPDEHGRTTFRSLMDLQPSPMFQAKNIPFFWNFKMPQSTVEEEYEDDATGETKKRYVNTARIKGWIVQKIGHTAESVPQGPEKSVASKLDTLKKDIMDKLRALFEQRPIWSRSALFAQLSDNDRRLIIGSKKYLPAVAYTFAVGPFAKTLIKFGYDPRLDRESHIYQRIYVYIQVNRARNTYLTGEDEADEETLKKRAPGWWEEEQERLVAEGLREPVDPIGQGYIFNGQVLHRDQPDYQLVDITDPQIAEYIKDKNNLVDVWDQKDGWYKPIALELIRSMMKTKFFYVRENAKPAPDSLCKDLIRAFTKTMAEDQGYRARLGDEATEDGEDDNNEEEESEGNLNKITRLGEVEEAVNKEGEVDEEAQRILSTITKNRRVPKPITSKSKPGQSKNS